MNAFLIASLFLLDSSSSLLRTNLVVNDDSETDDVHDDVYDDYMIAADMDDFVFDDDSRNDFFDFIYWIGKFKKNNSTKLENFISTDDTKISWTVNLKRDLEKIEQDFIDKQIKRQQDFNNEYVKKAKETAEEVKRIDDEKKALDDLYQSDINKRLEDQYNETRDMRMLEFETEAQIRKLKILNSKSTEEEKQKQLKESHEQMLRDEIAFLEKKYKRLNLKEEKQNYLNLKLIEEQEKKREQY
jgi:hypothetical protein